MPRIRSIKPEFWSDDKIVDLDILPKLLYIGLWNFADDDGLIEASVRRIKRLVFPDNSYNVEKAVDALLDMGMLVRCTSDQGDLFQIVKFRDHQKPQHPTPTKFTNVQVVSGTPHEDYANPHEGSLRSVGEGRSVVASPAATEEDFNRAYSHWPKKVERAKSLDKFKRVAAERGTEALIADIIRFGDAYARSTERKFVPALVAWLNGQRWEDELPGAEASAAPKKKQFIAGVYDDEESVA